MSLRRVGALFRRIVQEIRRDRPSLGILFIAPILLTGLVSFILRESQPPAISADIVNLAGPGASGVAGALRSALVADGATVADVSDEAAARADVRDGRMSLAIVLSANPADGLVV